MLADQRETARRLVCFTDGDDTSSAIGPDAVEATAQSAEVTIDFLALGRSDTGWAALEHVGQATQGSVAEVASSRGLGAAFAALARKVVTETDRSYYRLELEGTRRAAFLPGETISLDVDVAAPAALSGPRSVRAVVPSDPASAGR